MIEIIPSETIKSVPLTASFENKLKLMSQGKYKKGEFLKEIMINVEEFVEDVKNSKETNREGEKEIKTPSINREEEICKCPNCNSSIVKGKIGFGCSNWKNCKVVVFFDAAKRFGGKEITKTIAKQLLTNGITKEKMKLYSEKKQKEYEAYLIYSFELNEQYPNKIPIKFDK